MAHNVCVTVESRDHPIRIYAARVGEYGALRIERRDTAIAIEEETMRHVVFVGVTARDIPIRINVDRKGALINCRADPRGVELSEICQLQPLVRF